ncbi:hypothetical protein C2L64_51675 [Paraburkholderia hospita]|jgi:hypothetical protein|uniref:Uncharacterized protein n=1 Tax=Paraburkholderia hospita TaxID=169430 RepID=A0AAN1JLG4_9BURK|nr:hypothetical protein [Paraburkholderia hospita]AUT75701.1 hypothetical protein C2L64_46030 [Paraburkholderia hospita]AUT75930.1 hypothetical protein C2L64_47640 [Paraburkholderia hospita]AUT76603.1 hypothetical protein C2L64_51675 [Paraburkholderia hospita]
MSGAMTDYYAALERLKKRKNARINNDTVAIEAGRKKGSIKKSRPQFAELIEAIDAANAVAERPKRELTDRLNRAKGDAKDLQAQLDESLARELALLRQVFGLRKELAALRGGSVLPLQPR